MSMPGNILDKRTVQIGFITGTHGEPAYTTFTFSRLERSSMKP